MYLNIYRVGTLQLQEESIHFFDEAFIYVQKDILFQFFGSKLSKFLVSKATCFFLGMFKFSLCCSVTGQEQNLSSKIFIFHKTTIRFLIFWDFWMFYQIFLSPQVKRWAIITYKHGIYELPHELPNDLRLRNLGN